MLMLITFGYLLMQGAQMEIALFRSFIVFIGSSAILLVGRYFIGIIKQKPRKQADTKS